MSDVEDMTSQMAKELMLGIKDNVEDIAAAFKKMAIVNPKGQEPGKEEEPAPLPVAAAETITKLAEQRPRRRLDEAVMAAMLETENERRKRRRVVIDENQLSLFDVA